MDSGSPDWPQHPGTFQKSAHSPRTPAPNCSVLDPGNLSSHLLTWPLPSPACLLENVRLGWAKTIPNRGGGGSSSPGTKTQGPAESQILIRAPSLSRLPLGKDQNFAPPPKKRTQCLQCHLQQMWTGQHGAGCRAEATALHPLPDCPWAEGLPVPVFWQPSCSSRSLCPGAVPR